MEKSAPEVTRLQEASVLFGQSSVIYLGLKDETAVGNIEDINRISYFGNLYDDLFFHFPLFDNFDKQVKSTIADYKNAEYDCPNGFITSTTYLKQFIKNCNWIHIDLSSTISSDKYSEFSGIGKGTGIIPLSDFLIEKYGI